MQLIKRFWLNFKIEPDVWFFYAFLLTFPFSIRKILFYYPIQGQFNEYSAIFIYLSDIFLSLTLISWFIILCNKYYILSTIAFVRKTLYNLGKMSYPHFTPNLFLAYISLTLVIWAFLSISWSESKSLSLFRSIKILEFYFLAIYVAFRIVPSKFKCSTPTQMFHADQSEKCSTPTRPTNVPRGTFLGGWNNDWLIRKWLKLGLITFLGISLLVSFFPNLSLIQNQSLDQRETFANVSRGTIYANPILGIGEGQLVWSMRNLNLEKWQIQPVHNVFLLVWSELGIFGLLMLFLIFLEILKWPKIGENHTKECSTSRQMFHPSMNVPRGTFDGAGMEQFWEGEKLNSAGAEHNPRLRETFKLIILGGLINSILAIGQFISQKSIGLTFLKESVIEPNMAGVAKISLWGDKLIRAYGFFPHPNVLGGFLLLSIFLTVFYSRLFKPKSATSQQAECSTPVQMFHPSTNVPRGTFYGAGVEHFTRPVWNIFGWINKFRLKKGDLKNSFFLWGLILAIQIIALILTFSKSAFFGLAVALVYYYVSRGTLNSERKEYTQNTVRLEASEFLSIFKSIILSLFFIMLFDHYPWDIQQGQIMLWLVLGVAMGLVSKAKE